MEETNRELFEKVVKVAQARGFVFNASSIYGGLRSSYDYGPLGVCLLYTSPSPRDQLTSRMPSSA